MIDYSLYFYRAKVVDVYDGDTITCEVDLGVVLVDTSNLYGVITESKNVDDNGYLNLNEWLIDNDYAERYLL